MATADSPFPSRLRSLPPFDGHARGFRLAADGCEVIFVHAAAGMSIPPHTHDTDNVTAILSGETIVTIDGDERRYGPGEWYETSAGEPHAVRCDVECVQIELRFEPR